MKHFTSCILAMLAFVATSICRADLLEVTLTELPLDRVEISWSGSGIADGASPFQTFNDLDFRDFFDATGLSPYGPSIAFDGSGSGRDYTLLASATPLTLTINPGPAEVNRTFGSIRLDREDLGGGNVSSDFSLLGSGTPLFNGDTYEVSGSAVVDAEILDAGTGDALKFSDLNEGTYIFTGSTDADVFGGVRLNIVSVAIPEPSVILFGSLICGAIGIRYHRTRSRSVTR